MVLEVALIDVRDGSAEELAAAHQQAEHLPATTPACGPMRMTQGGETPTRFVLIIDWDSVEAHDAVRQGDGFGQWRALIGPHFAGPPHVEHFTDL